VEVIYDILKTKCGRLVNISLREDILYKRVKYINLGFVVNNSEDRSIRRIGDEKQIKNFITEFMTHNIPLIGKYDVFCCDGYGLWRLNWYTKLCSMIAINTTHKLIYRRMEHMDFVIHHVPITDRGTRGLNRDMRYKLNSYGYITDIEPLSI
jgi:hypothetical protein